MSQPPGSRIYLVAAVAANGIIGAKGELPWRLPEDLKHFKRITMGHPIIMGRRTWESLKGALPGRDNIVVTRRAGYEAPGAAVANSLEAALALCMGEPLVFVIGGSQLFAESLPIAAGLVMTEIHKDFEGDTRFPDYDRSRWRESQRERHVAADGMPFDFVLYEPI
ncbi:MAG TPA: dihydrofolate reductase [Burkholderiales bacterium]|nr:dihydrofolate reductase [Burkholderiales bacterium]